MKLYKKAFKKVTIEETVEDKLRAVVLDLMSKERELTKGLFGELEAGRKRDFFCLDEDTWIWYEEWQEKGARKNMTTHYRIQPDHIAKSQNGGPLERLSAKEVKHFIGAIQKYNTIVQNQLYS